MRTLCFLITIFSLSSLNAWAVPPTVTQIDGASARTLTGSVPVIYGGFAGDACVGTSNTETCNNCSAAANNCGVASDPLCACNTTRAYEDLMVTITLATADAGNAILVKTDGTTVINILRNSPSNGAIAQFTWRDMCTALFASSCETAALTTDANFRIYIDKDNSSTVTTGEESVEIKLSVMNPTAGTYDVFAAGNDGIGGFTPYPGDAKIFLEDPITATNFPDLNFGTQNDARSVRVFISDQNITLAHPETSLTPADLPIDEEGNELEDSVVDGLENGVPYVFRIALLDRANNVVQFYPSAATVAATAPACSVSPPDPATCPWAARPDEVLGLLTDDLNCFIASAAYGSALEPKLNGFRKFRFKILSRYPWGVEFVKKYYAYGPHAARYIHDKPFLRTLTRGALWPLYGFSQLALGVGLWPSILLSLFFLSLILTLPWYALKRWSARA